MGESVSQWPTCEEDIGYQDSDSLSKVPFIDATGVKDFMQSLLLDQDQETYQSTERLEIDPFR